MSWVMVVLFLIGSVFAETASAQGQKPIPQNYEVNVFGGGSFFKQQNDPLKTKLVSGGIVGLRLTENAWERFSLEQSWTFYGRNNIRFHTGPSSTTDFGSRIMELGVQPILHFASKESRIRPFATIGYQTTLFAPTQKAQNASRVLPNPVAAASMGQFQDVAHGSLNYGGGVKARLSPGGRVALRFDVLGIMSKKPHFGLATSGQPGAIYIPDQPHWIHGVQPTLGLTFYLGAPKPPAPPPPPPLPAPPVPHTLELSDIRGNQGDVCPGTPVNLSVATSEAYNVAYQWTVDGTNQGTNSPEFRYVAPDGAQEHRVAVTARDESGYSSPASPVTKSGSIRVKRADPPSITASAQQSEVKYPGSINLQARAVASECGGNVTTSWSASEGTIVNGAQPRFDSATVNFDTSNRDRLQTKTITLTATARDAQGKTASTPVTVRVSLDPAARRFDDIVFPKNGSRINNCGKRILLDEIYPLLAGDSNYDLVLVGHIDEAEVPKPSARKAPELDRDRVVNAAAVLTSGGGTNARLEPSRVKVDWVGTDQSADLRPGFCGTSTRSKTKERPNQGVAESDANAKNRRVEVWLVPKGAPMPASVKALKDLPPAPTKTRGLN